MPQDHPLVILCAMRDEAAPIAAALDLHPADAPWPSALPPRLYTHASRPIRLVINGVCDRTGVDLIGTNPATLATHLIATHLNPRAILVAGAAGGSSRHTDIAHIHLIDRAYYHDRRIPLPGFDAYGRGPEPLHHSEQLAAAFGATIATISTGNAIDTLPSELDFFNTHNITVKDMETAAIAWTANLHAIPTLALRAITDFYDHPTPETQFLANFKASLESLAHAVSQGIDGVLSSPSITN
jgi:nucleoside phosphorylase